MQKFCKYKKVYILKHVRAYPMPAGIVERTGRERVVTGFWLGNLKKTTWKT